VRGANPVWLAGRLAKLRAMSAREVTGRAQYQLFTTFERRQHRSGTLAAPGRLERALVADLRGAQWRARLLTVRCGSKARFFPGVHDPVAMRRLFAGPFHGGFQDTLAQAARAREQRFEFFGREFHYTGEIDWQADPVTGRRWPSLYHADVPVHGGDVGYGDVKHVWELSRQQYLIDLGKAFHLGGDEADLAVMRRLVRSWVAGNPYATGVNWSCALEPAFRAWSWLWAYHLTAGALDDDFHLEWLQAFHDHGRFLARHLEHYSSPYNHLIGEASALYALGVCFPEFHESGQWRRSGRSVLEKRLGTQFYADGGSVEQSTFYHHATTGFYILSVLLARENGEEFSTEVWSAIERAIEFSMQMMQPDGRTPEIGGADDGKPIRMEHLPFWEFRPYQAIGAVLFKRPDFKAVAGRFHEDALWVLGPAGLEIFEALDSNPPQNASAVLPASGYAVSRSSWDSDADYVCFDVGEQAAGMRPDNVPNSMHGHADCLSVIVCLGGRRVLVDSGLYAYNCGGEWEAHFRETAAHNTARVNGSNQARHLGKMAWSQSYRATLEASMVGDRHAWAVGSHDGYARGPDGVTHRRSVWQRPNGYVLIHDEFVGHGSHELEVNYQFAPGGLHVSADGHALFDGFAELAWVGAEAWTVDVRCGGPGAADGWICGSLGVRRAAPRLTLTGALRGGRTSLLTVLARGSSRVRVVSEEGVRLVTVAGERGVEWIAADGITIGTAISTDAPLAVCRLGVAGELEQSQVQGSYLQIDRRQLERLSASAAPLDALR